MVGVGGGGGGEGRWQSTVHLAPYGHSLGDNLVGGKRGWGINYIIIIFTCRVASRPLKTIGTRSPQALHVAALETPQHRGPRAANTCRFHGKMSN